MRPPACSFLMYSSLSLGVACARKSSTPASDAIAAAVSGLSPVTITERSARIGVQHLTQTVWPSVVKVRTRRSRRIPIPAFRKRRDDADAREHKNQERRRQDGKERHLDFLLLDFLADVFGR